MKRKLIVTSALPYANGPLHLGHLVETIQTDIFVRFQKLRGNDCHYFCADDAHGTPVMLSAKAKGVSPDAYVEDIRRSHMEDFAGFSIKFDWYHSTHSEENKLLSYFFYKKALEKGCIEEKEIEQYFCPSCTLFLPDRLIKGNCPTCQEPEQYGDSCEKCASTYDPTQLGDPHCVTCGSVPILKKTTHLFFKLAPLASQIQTWLRSGVARPSVLNKLKEWFDMGLKDWCISRDAPYFGFEIPDKPGKFFYVWLDAPVGYLASMKAWGQAHDIALDSLWPPALSDGAPVEIHHFIGKDILYFHTLFWPAMLITAEKQLPSRVHVHGFLTVNGEKMSKSRGTFILAKKYLDLLPAEYFRYYLASKLGAEAEDLDFGQEDFMFKVNSDIVNKVVNIGSRLGSVLHKKCGGKMTTLDADGEALLKNCRSKISNITALYETLETAHATREIMGIADQINKYIDEKAPWSVANTDPVLAAQICTSGLNGLYLLSGLLSPIVPELSASLFNFLQTEFNNWSVLDKTLVDHEIAVYEHLAKRIEASQVSALTQA